MTRFAPRRPLRGLRRPDRDRLRPAAVGVVAGLASLAAGAVLLAVPTARPVAAPPDAGQVPTAAPVTTGAAPTAVPSSATPLASPAGGSGTVPPSPPTRLRLPDLGVTAAVGPVGLRRDGGLSVPPDPRRLGWWRGGALPGDHYGAVVLAGHVDDLRRGRGALYRIGELRIGARILVDTATGTRTYRVTARRTYRKRALPADAFARTVPGRLTLITCTTPYDPRTHSYASNLVVYATPA